MAARSGSLEAGTSFRKLLALKEEQTDDRVLASEEASLFRGASARANYLAMDRLDLSFSAK